MAEKYAHGCPACNQDVAYAQERMARLPDSLDVDAWWERYGFRYRVTLDGDDTTGWRVVAIVPGADGWLRAWHCAPGQYVDPHAVGPHPCACGSEHLAEVVWRGAVAIERRA